MHPNNKTNNDSTKVLTINNPTVLVGLPRSGSTLLTRILNESPDHYVLNDLYVLQKVDKQNTWDGLLDISQALEIKNLLSGMVRHRSAVLSPKGIANSAVMTAAQLDKAMRSIEALWPSGAKDGLQQDWSQLIAAIISTAANTLGKRGWGWNTPQDYHHIDRIIQKWPDARIVFMMRDPRGTLKSYKYYPKKPASDRYHPAAQSMAWRNAARAWARHSARYPNNLLLLIYEDVVENTARELRRLNEFLPATIPEDIDLSVLGNNSSFTSGDQKKISRTLSPIEMWLSDLVLYPERLALGFTYPRQSFNLKGIFALLNTTLRFARHYSSLLSSDADVRRRVQRLLGVR